MNNDTQPVEAGTVFFYAGFVPTDKNGGKIFFHGTVEAIEGDTSFDIIDHVKEDDIIAHLKEKEGKNFNTEDIILTAFNRV